MGFPENVLTPGEKVHRSLHPHWMTMLGPTVVGLILAGAAAFTAWATPDDTTGNRIQWAAVALAVLLAIPLVLVPFLRWRTTRYIITSHRVMVRRGILTRVGKDITLSKITDVSFEQSLLDRIIRSGTLTIESAGDSPDERMRNIPRSDEIQQLLNRLIDEDANKRAQRLIGGRHGGRSQPGEDASTEPRKEPAREPGKQPGHAASEAGPDRPEGGEGR